MDVRLPNYLDLNSVRYFIQVNEPAIYKTCNVRIQDAFYELRSAIEEYQQQQVEKQEREQLARLKAKYEASEKTNGKKEYFLTKSRS